MPGEAQTFSIIFTRDELEAMKPVLQRFYTCQTQEAWDISVLGIKPMPKKLILACALITSLWLATTKPNEVLGRVFLGGMAMIFWVVFGARLVLGHDRQMAVIRNNFIDLIIRLKVNLRMYWLIKRAPYSVVYRFSDASYTARIPDLNSSGQSAEMMSRLLTTRSPCFVCSRITRRA